MSLAWCAVFTLAGREKALERRLNDRRQMLGLDEAIARVAVPLVFERGPDSSAGRPVPRLTGYVLIQLEPEDSAAITAVRQTPGVIGFVGCEDSLEVIPDDEVESLLSNDARARPLFTFRVGQPVQVVDGPFAEQQGIIESIEPKRARATVLIRFFGRDTAVAVDLAQLAPLV